MDHINKKIFSYRFVLIISLILLSTILYLFIFVNRASAAIGDTDRFYVFSNISSTGNTFEQVNIQATVVYEGIRGRFYVSNSYLNRLSQGERSLLRGYVEDASSRFDTKVYPAITDVYGHENSPGVDGDDKITFLFYDILDPLLSAFFSPIDSSPSFRLEGCVECRSNTREMIYINSVSLDVLLSRVSFLHAKSISGIYGTSNPAKEVVMNNLLYVIAHEATHLIQHNQKTLKRDVLQEHWLSELLAEASIHIVSEYNDEQNILFSFQKRLNRFLSLDISKHLTSKIVVPLPNFSINRWDGSQKDYSKVSVFGRYLYEQFGDDFLEDIMKNNAIGVDALEKALLSNGYNGIKLEDILVNWGIANVVNDCVMGNSYCYKNRGMSYYDFHINLGGFRLREQDVYTDANPGAYNIINQSVPNYSTEYLNIVSDGYYENRSLNISVSTIENIDIVREPIHSAIVNVYNNGEISIEKVEIKGNDVVDFRIPNFGSNIRRSFFVFVNPNKKDVGIVSHFYLSSEATSEELVDITNTSLEVPLIDIRGNILVDGDVVKLPDNPDVYIIKIVGDELYKRLILNPDIFNSYGHLNWGKIKIVDKAVLGMFKESRFIIEVYPNGDPVNDIIYFLIPLGDFGTKRSLVNITREEFLRQYDWDYVFYINHTEASDTFYSRGRPFSSLQELIGQAN